MPSLRFGNNTRDAFGAPLQGPGSNNMNFPYDMQAAQTWNGGAPMQSFASNGMGAMTQNGDYGPSRGIKPSRGRTGINNVSAYPDLCTTRLTTMQLWYDSPHGHQQNNHSILAPRPGPGRQDNHEDDEELIPTAIVIKNIPFAVKKEQLVQLMVDMNLPLPYAFNYHFDNGVFRGLAFANFTSPSETDQVINALNHMELSGRKLRVEFKKMLPLAERERIEREKRERRGQLEEQHRPMGGQLNAQISMGSMARNTPSPMSQRAGKPGMPLARGADASILTNPDVDMNDPKTLEFYTEMMLFRRDVTREVLIFPATLDPPSRRIVHTLAHHMGLQHTSRGTGEQRQVHILRPAAGTNVSPPSASGGFAANDNLRQNLARASTSDFGDARAYEPMFNNNILRGQSSVGLLDVDNSNYGRNADSNLRNAKSFADLRSWSPSPVPSSASFPAALQTNGARLQQQVQSMNDTAGSNTPTLTPTASSNGGGAQNEPPFLISGVNNMTLSNGTGNSTSPRRQRMYGGWGGEDGSYQGPAIGTKRTVSIGPESTTQDRNPLRQPRGTNSHNPIGFGSRRQNGRGSDELRTTSAIAE